MEEKENRMDEGDRRFHICRWGQAQFRGGGTWNEGDSVAQWGLGQAMG
jgi:hypothetical protein